MATIQDVAKKAGVSVATVSRVLNKNQKVTQKSALKVERAIRELDYHPNFLARDLRKAESNRILVLLQTISNPFYATIVRGIEDVARRHGYSIMLCNTDSDLEREKEYLTLLYKKMVQGAIFLDTEMSTEQLNELAENNSLVLCCEYRKGVNVPHVMIDNYRAAKTIVEHLIGFGHRKIGLICGDRHLESTMLRYNGYVDALKEHGIAMEDNFIFQSSESSFQMGQRAVETLLYKSAPTAIFSMSDIMAIGALKALHKKGIRVPQEMAVAGFDGIEYSAVSVPGLTTIKQPNYEMGCAAMELLIQKMHNETIANEELIFEYELLIRESTLKNV